MHGRFDALWRATHASRGDFFKNKDALWRASLKAVAQVIYGFLFSWGVLWVWGIPMALKITVVLSIAFIPGWMVFNQGYKWCGRTFRVPTLMRGDHNRRKKGVGLGRK